jgi:hypothetical protein
MKNFSIFGSRIYFFLLAPWLLLGVLVFSWIAYGQFEEKRLGGLLISVVLAICCLCGLLIGISPRRFGSTVVFVTGSVAAGYIWYFCETYFVQGQVLAPSARRSDATPWNAMLGFIFIGLPCLIITVRGIFSWIYARRRDKP